MPTLTILFFVLTACSILVCSIHALKLPTTRSVVLKTRSLSCVSEMVSESGNKKLDSILNLRDLASVSDKVKASKVIRTGCVSKASENDIAFMHQQLGVKVYIDLRSKAEIEEDDCLDSKIYEGCQSFSYNKKLKTFTPLQDDGTVSVNGRKRYFVSLMSESLIKKNVFFGFRKRTRALIVGLLTLSNFSRRAEKKVRSMFIDTINDGGLGLLNQFVFKNSGNELSSILKIIAEEENHPVVMYCTAGKDRTGVIAMLVLSILGVSDADIVRDYVKSDSAYADINDSKALVAGLKQVDVDPNIFLRAFPEVMEQSLTFVRSTYGSVDNYLDSVGFDESWRRKLRLALLAK